LVSVTKTKYPVLKVNDYCQYCKLPTLASKELTFVKHHKAEKR